MVLKGEYKGYEIQCNGEFFTIHKDGCRVNNRTTQSLDKAQEWIDNQLKVKYKRVKVLLGYMGRKSGDPFTEAEATSIVEEDSAWVVSEKERGKKWLPIIFVDTPDNRDLIGQIREKEISISTLNKEISDIRAKLITLTPEMMIEGGKP